MSPAIEQGCDIHEARRLGVCFRCRGPAVTTFEHGWEILACLNKPDDLRHVIAWRGLAVRYLP